VTAGLVRQWLEAGRLELPLPGSGRTAERWRRLAMLAENDVAAARIGEAHADAAAILHELGGKPPEAGQLWGVWAAEARHSALDATQADTSDCTLNGVKAWCSAASFCTHALVTAQLSDGRRGLYAVTLTDPGIKPLPNSWWNSGMAGSDTRPVQFTQARAVAVGEPGDYLCRPGFWHGARSASRPAGSAARALSQHRCTAAPATRQLTRMHWHTLAPWMPRSPPPSRR
jgi:alkylation response protein AidB-like acyl-CoA dehydrogenase